METDTVRPDLDAIEERWGGARPGLLTIVDHAVKDVADLLAYVRHLERQWDELNGLRVDERNHAYTAEQALERALATIARVRQMADAWEQRLPETILTATAVEALRSATGHYALASHADQGGGSQ